MLEKSFDEILEEREAAIRQQWAAQSKAKKIADAGDSSDGLIEGKRAMRTLTDEEHKRIYKVVCEVAGRNGVEGVELSGDADNPFSYFLEIPLAVDEQIAVKTCNELFHALGLLPEGKNLALGELGDYCNYRTAGRQLVLSRRFQPPDCVRTEGDGFGEPVHPEELAGLRR